MKSKQLEAQNLVFSPGTWIQKYATTPHMVTTCVPSLSPRSRKSSMANAHPGAGGPRRLRGGRAAAAPRTGGPRAAWGPEHRWTLIAVNNLAFVLKRLGKFSEAPLMCCAAFCVGPNWGNAGKQSTHFQIISKFCHLCRSAVMHEHFNFTQIISNNPKSRHVWTCKNMDM